MKPETQKIISLIEELTQGLYYSLVGDELFVVTTWLTEEKPSFSLENFLLDKNALSLGNIENFNNQNLIDLLEGNLSNLIIYNYDFPKLPPDLFGGSLPIEDKKRQQDKIPVFIGETKDGEWLGIMPNQDSQTESCPQFIIDNIKPSDSTKELLSQINSITSKSIHQSQCWSLTGSWNISITDNRDYLMEKLLADTQFLEIYDVEKFLKLDEQEDSEQKSKYLQLRDLFKNQLLNSKVYNLVYMVGGEYFVVHYALGEIPNGDWVGLITDSFTF